MFNVKFLLAVACALNLFMLVYSTACSKRSRIVVRGEIICEKTCSRAPNPKATCQRVFTRQRVALCPLQCCRSGLSCLKL